MGWARRVGLSLVVASLAVTASVAANQLLSGNERLSWTALYFVLVFTVPGALLTQLPAVGGEGKASRPSRRRYLRRMRASVEQMETIGLVTQAEYVLRTRQVYVDVALQPRPVTETVPDGGVGGAPSGPAGSAGQPGVRKPLSSFLVPGNVLAVLGAAGSGKTTLVRYTALTLAEQRWWPWRADFWRPRRIPVLLYMRDHAQAILADPNQNLAAVASAAPWLEGAVSGPWLQRRLEQRRCVILLDGLDEVADARERATVVGWVNTQVNRYPGNTVVITSRPLGYDANRVTQADVLQVQRFTHAQIAEFLGAWFHAIEHRARQGADTGEIDRIAACGAHDLFRRITDMPALLDLAANPLLLTMIANVHRYRGSLPGSRVDLYAEMCQVLLHRRQEAKNLLALPPALDDLGGDTKERLIRRLAWKMMLQRQRDIPAADAEKALGALPYPRQPGPPLTAKAFLDYAHRSGLLLEHKPGHYGFAHLSLQEYLAATHVPGDDSRLRTLISKVSVSWWRETILLWAARNDASRVVEVCAAPVSQDLWNRYLRHLHRGDSHVPPPAAAAEQGLVLGLSATDLPDFLNWLNSLFNDGPAYRLPTVAELIQLSALTKIPPGTVWTYDEATGYRLYQPDGIPHPHVPTPAQLHAYPGVIIERTCLVLHLAMSTTLRLPRLLLYGSITARQDLPRRPEYQLIYALDLLATIEAADVLDSGFASGRDLSLTRARHLARVLGLDLDVDDPGSFAIVSADAFDPNRPLNSNLDSAFALVLDRAIHPDPDPNPDLSRILSLNGALAFVRTLALDLGLDGDFALDLDRDLDLARALDHALVLDRDLDRDLVCDFVRALASGPDLDRARTITLGRDLAVARLLQSDRRYSDVTWAGIGLLEAWTHRLVPDRKLTPGLRAFMSQVLSDYTQVQPKDDPTTVLRRVIEATGTQAENVWVNGLLSRAYGLIAPARDNNWLADKGNLVLAATLVLAALLAVNGPAQEGEVDGSQVVLLKGVLTTLIALTTPEHQNQTVLLARV